MALEKCSVFVPEYNDMDESGKKAVEEQMEGVLPLNKGGMSLLGGMAASEEGRVVAIDEGSADVVDGGEAVVEGKRN